MGRCNPAPAFSMSIAPAERTSGHAKGSAALFPPPGLSERCHRGLARRVVAVRRRAVLVMAESERPHPRRANGRGMHLHDPPDGHAVGEHVEIILVPLAG